MTVTLFSWTPPTTQASKYLLRATPLNGPRAKDALEQQHADDVAYDEETVEREHVGLDVLQDIDDWYSQTIEDDGFLERLDRSAESVRFP